MIIMYRKWRFSSAVLSGAWSMPGVGLQSEESTEVERQKRHTCDESCGIFPADGVDLGHESGGGEQKKRHSA